MKEGKKADCQSPPSKSLTRNFGGDPRQDMLPKEKRHEDALHGVSGVPRKNLQKRAPEMRKTATNFSQLKNVRTGLSSTKNLRDCELH
jgi:hypothetical protein